MNDFIAVFLMSRLLHIPYVDKFGGIVQTIQRTTKSASGENVVVRLPVAKAFNQFEPSEDPESQRTELLKCGLVSKTLESMLPESKLSGLVYFEDNGVSPDINRRHSGINFFRSNIRVVGWFNQKKFRNEFDNNFRSEAMLEFMDSLETKRPIRKVGNFHNVNVAIDGMPSLDASIFSEY